MLIQPSIQAKIADYDLNLDDEFHDPDQALAVRTSKSKKPKNSAKNVQTSVYSVNGGNVKKPRGPAKYSLPVQSDPEVDKLVDKLGNTNLSAQHLNESPSTADSSPRRRNASNLWRRAALSASRQLSRGRGALRRRHRGSTGRRPEDTQSETDTNMSENQGNESK